MSSHQKEQHLKRLNNEMFEDSSRSSPILHTIDPEQTHLSVSIKEFADNARVPKTCLEGLWSKSSRSFASSSSNKPVTTILSTTELGTTK